MWWAVGALACLTAATHLGFSWFPEMTPARWFYVLRGLEGAALFVLLPALTMRKLTRAQAVVLATTTILGATMEALTAICGLAFYWGKGPLPARADGLMCDAAHPQAWAWGTVAVCVAVLWVVTRERR